MADFVTNDLALNFITDEKVAPISSLTEFSIYSVIHKIRVTRALVRRILFITTAIANMTAVTQVHGAAHKAFVIVPLVGGFFIDLINAVVVSTMVGFS